MLQEPTANGGSLPSLGASSCTLPYPDRFIEAVQFASKSEGGALSWCRAPRGGRAARSAALLACRLARVDWARPAIAVPTTDDGALPEESKLLLYSLHQQATVVRAWLQRCRLTVLALGFR